MTRKNGTKRIALTIATCMLVCSAVACSSGCSPQATSGHVGKESGRPDALEAVAWSVESDCSACHNTESNSLVDASCLAATHQNEGTRCIDCHTNNAELSAVHENSTASDNMPTKLKKTEVDDASCTPCHGTYDDLAAATPDTTIADNKGTSVNPHEAPNLTEGHEGNITCASCHSMHSASNATDDARQVCANCHHEDVFECGTCHS